VSPVPDAVNAERCVAVAHIMTNHGTPQRIVLVEDDPDVARSTRRVLSSLCDVTVEVCHDVSGAKRSLARPFDVLVSDFQLPDGTGVDVLRAAANFNDNAPAIVLTAHTQWDCAAASINDGGAYRVLGKPVTAEVLMATVREALATKRSRDQRAQSIADERLAAVPASRNDRERILRALARAIDRRVGRDVARADALAIIGRGLAESVGLSHAAVAAVELTILAHRIGSVGLRDHESAALVPLIGAEILRTAGFPEGISKAVEESGECPREAQATTSIAVRILAIASRYLELTSGNDRAHERACAEMLRDETLDAALVAAFVTEPERAWSSAGAHTIPFRPVVVSKHPTP